MLKRAAIIFGSALVAGGVLGFIPGITVDGHLLGLFRVDTAHNFFHIISGAIAAYAGYKSEHAAHRYFQIFGVLYAFLAFAGLFYRDAPLFGTMAHNTADVVLHFLIAAVALYLGFAVREREVATA
jgi:hypothetical protein